MKRCLRELFHDESGQDLAEYTLLITLIAIACIGAVSALGGGVQQGMQAASDGMVLGGSS